MKFFSVFAKEYNLAPSEGLRGPGPFQDIPKTTSGIGDKIGNIFSKAIGLLSVVAIIWFLIQLILAGINFISAGGNKEKMAEAQKRITQSAFGLIVVLTATAMVAFLGYILGGINFLDLGGLLELLE